MINFQNINLNTFLQDYWQKKPLLIRNALPGFINPLSPDELAGLALEEEIESRIVLEGDKAPYWQLQRGPFTEDDFSSLPETNWTLLVQGVDRVIPEVYALLDHFDFIPQWRIDDVMISFAALNGSVGPHYDHYDVFLFQAKGRRKWSLTSKNCTDANYISDLDLRIMKEFDIEEEFILEEGDMLYLPPHIGHYGIALTEECMTYSFGYRSYQGQELLESLSDHVAEKESFKTLYQDPDWSHQEKTSQITTPALQQAKILIQKLLDDEALLKSWFGCFVTRIDQQAEQQMALPLEEEEQLELTEFLEELKASPGLFRDSCCRFAYIASSLKNDCELFINGCTWDIQEVSEPLVALVANQRWIDREVIEPFLKNPKDQIFLYELWKLQWMQI